MLCLPLSLWKWKVWSLGVWGEVSLSMLAAALTSWHSCWPAAWMRRASLQWMRVWPWNARWQPSLQSSPGMEPWCYTQGGAKNRWQLRAASGCRHNDNTIGSTTCTATPLKLLCWVSQWRSQSLLTFFFGIAIYATLFAFWWHVIIVEIGFAVIRKRLSKT